jgi:hypothetical protein
MYKSAPTTAFIWYNFYLENCGGILKSVACVTLVRKAANDMRITTFQVLHNKENK